MPELVLQPPRFDFGAWQTAMALARPLGVGVLLSIMTVQGHAPINVDAADRAEMPVGGHVLAAEFTALARQWEADTTTYSSDYRDLILHWAYQRIIGIGPAALPHILAALAQKNDHWSWALQAITGENPVPAAGAGDPDAIREAWLAWGRARGLVAA